MQINPGSFAFECRCGENIYDPIMQIFVRVDLTVV